MKFPCRICGEEIANQHSLKIHFKADHPRNLQFQCLMCPKEFDDLKELDEHNKLSHQKSYSECSICFIKVNSKAELQQHNQTAHSGIARNVCQICNRVFCDNSALAKHRYVHTGERPYSCPFCLMTFTLKSSQVVHVRRHTNERPFKCKLCPKAYFNSGDLKKHINSHTREQAYQCDICKVNFAFRVSLNNHLKSHSTSIRPFKCPKCRKAFTNKTSLKYHMPIHEGVRPFKCPLCSETSLHLGHLRSHIKNHHIVSDSSVIKCKICGEKRNTLEMAQHLMTHRSDCIPERERRKTNRGVTRLVNNVKLRKGRSRKFIQSKIGEENKVAKDLKGTTDNCTADKRTGQPSKTSGIVRTKTTRNIPTRIIKKTVAGKILRSRAITESKIIETILPDECPNEHLSETLTETYEDAGGENINQLNELDDFGNNRENEIHIRKPNDAIREPVPEIILGLPSDTDLELNIDSPPINSKDSDNRLVEEILEFTEVKSEPEEDEDDINVVDPSINLTFHQCNICKLIFPSEEILLEHVYVHII